MKLPTKVLSHCLAHGPAVTPEILSRTLPHDRELGYRGQVIVAALALDQPLDGIIDAFQRENMTALVCGFMAGNGPDPLEDKEAALAALYPQMVLARELYLSGVGPNGTVGPMHTHHKRPRARTNFDFEALGYWAHAVDALREEIGLEWAAFEPLNAEEDGTPDAFDTVSGIVSDKPNLGIHWDSGHAHSWSLSDWDMVQLGGKVRFCELTNVGRSPLTRGRGIDFGRYFASLPRLPDGCLVGVEPFDPSVIEAFDLRSVCDTKVLGPACLTSDADYLAASGVLG